VELLTWRGKGYVGIVAMFPFISILCKQVDWIIANNNKSDWILLIWLVAILLSLVFAGAVCVHFGSKWNYLNTKHTLWFIPLQIWGWFYLAGTCILTILLVVGGIYRMIKPFPGQPSPAVPLTCGVFGFLLVVVTIRTLIRLTSKLHVQLENKPNSGLHQTFGANKLTYGIRRWGG
jgi:hypothetical protein